MSADRFVALYTIITTRNVIIQFLKFTDQRQVYLMVRVIAVLVHSPLGCNSTYW